MPEGIVLLVQLYGSINWVASKTDELRIPLASVSGWTLLHPAFLPQQQTRLDDERYMLAVSVLALEVPDSELTERDCKRVQGFLRNLRHQSRQPELPVEVSGYSRDASAVSSVLQFVEDATPFLHFQRYFVQTAVNNTHVCAAAQLPENFRPPIYEELYLEAVRAVRDHDDRKAVLYSAIAIESCAQVKLRAQIEADLADGNPLARSDLRVIEVATHAGNKRKDPIYSFLEERARFSTWLHELPLYVLNRSMLVQERSLYADAIALSKLRNILAHSGQVPDEDDSDGIALDGSDAVKVAGRCLAWFDVPGAILDPDFAFAYFDPKGLQAR